MITHIKVIEALIEAGLMFIEEAEMVYKITNSPLGPATLFARTGVVAWRHDLKSSVRSTKPQSLNQAIVFLTEL